MKRLIFCISMSLLAAIIGNAKPAFDHFITVRGDQLIDGDRPFRFISFNIPNLLIVEDYLPFAATNAWRLPDEFEIQDALAAVHQMGGTVVRTYSIPIWRGDDPPAECSYILGTDKYNENAFRVLDLALKLANENGVRLIIPLANNWKWQGGRGEFAGFRGKTADEFWTDPQLIADFERTVRYVLLRTNTLTGVRYCDDKAVLCWETGNELYAPPSWTREIAGYIKGIDHNHLVMDGLNAAVLQPDSLSDPYIDIVTTHEYPGPRMRETFSQIIRRNWELAKGKKPYVVGEFGFVGTAEMEKAMKTIMDTGTAGGLLWSLRFHDRDGGYYWHSEPSGDNLYKAFHWPGSPIGAAYDEIPLMAIVRSNAFEIRGMTPPPVDAPLPPRLLPITNPGEISWQGSVGAATYDVERAATTGGPWKRVGKDVDESAVQYYPVFADESVPAGEWYYRIIAKNGSGSSKPSNVVGPVTVTNDILVDNLADFSKLYARHGDLTIATRDCRKAKEDIDRAAGKSGSTLIYRVPGTITGFRVFTFFPGNIDDLKFSVSGDGQTYSRVRAQKDNWFEGVGDYDYWKPVLYHAEHLAGAGNFLKIELTGNTQIGRVEIVHSQEKN